MPISEKTSLSSLSVEELDQHAWKVICNWPLFSDIKTEHDGLDYSLLISRFLWDKVGRAIRKEIAPEHFEFESSFQNIRSGHQKGFPQRAKSPLHAFYSKMKGCCDLYNSLHLKLRSSLRNGHVLYMPVNSLRLKSIIPELIHYKSILMVTSALQLSRCFELPYLSAVSREIKPDYGYAEKLHKGTILGLRRLGIELLDNDAVYLKQQVLQQMTRIKGIEAAIRVIKPDAVLVHADNHPPHQDYVLVAQREGVPSIMLQHGLDCEHYFLDEAYASAIALWSENRLRRYQQKSKRQPLHMQITGNPAYDHLCLPEDVESCEGYWLWVTRPHTPQKCYAPSRYPQEGIDIFEALLGALLKTSSIRLVIKPHPYDYRELYQKLIAEKKLAGRVEISTKEVQSLFPGAGIVISEDSSAGMEAMFWGKIIIHTHFAQSKPVMPFVDYGAALPAFSTEMLQDTLQHSIQLTKNERDTILRGQRAFLNDFAGPCDGRAKQRIKFFIADIMNSGKN